MTVYEHIPVMGDEVLAFMRPADGEVFVDCTLGGGGHTRALLNAANCRVIGIDRDQVAIDESQQQLAEFGPRFVAVKSRFSDLGGLLRDHEQELVDGIIADLGVSSPQLDTPQRGFSFRNSGPVDMRMDGQASLSAATVVNEWDEADLTRILKEYGEETRARAVARAIVAGRPWHDTVQLAEVIARHAQRPRRIHAATRSFQAIRVAVNDELGELKSLLSAAVEALKPGGRLAIISFHSLEDRIVKRFFAMESGKAAPRDPWGNPIGVVRLKTQRSIAPSANDPNPRARSARLRTAMRLPWNE